MAVTDGANGAHWRQGPAVRHLWAFAVHSVATLAAGDVFHGAFALALVEGQDEAESLRFAAAAAALKCTRFAELPARPVVPRSNSCRLRSHHAWKFKKSSRAAQPLPRPAGSAMLRVGMG